MAHVGGYLWIPLVPGTSWLVGHIKGMGGGRVEGKKAIPVPPAPSMQQAPVKLRMGNTHLCSGHWALLDPG